MTELSLNILDIAQNSVSAKATRIEIKVNESRTENLMLIEIVDNGCGMSEETLKAVQDPFYTSRTTRKVGLGIPFFKLAAELTGGSFELKSELGKGTTVQARFVHDSIDRPPLGDMRETMITLIKCNPELNFIYEHRVDEKKFILDMEEIRSVLRGISPDEPEVLAFISEYFENEKEL